MCEFNNEEYEFEASYGISRKGSDKSMISDFLFYDSQRQPVYLEIVQNTDANRGNRRESYAKRHKKKVDALNQHGIFPICVVADEFYDHGIFNAELFARDVSERLSQRNVELKKVPEERILARQFNDYANFLISSDKKTVFDHLINEKGISGAADLSNNFSTLKNLLKARSDNFLDELYRDLTAWSKKQRSEKLAARRKEIREQMMPLSKLKAIVRKQKIHTQRQWFDFARENKKFLHENNIPCDVASVYARLGDWISWPDFYGKKVAS
jgi:hypothetical protein